MTTPINILDTALTVEGGEPEAITLMGHELTIRKNYTGTEVHELLRWINAETDDDSLMTLEEQMKGMYGMLSIDKPAKVKEFVTTLIGLRVVEMQRINQAVFKLAGLADDRGNFLGGA